MQNNNSILKVLDAYKTTVYARDVDAFTALYDKDIQIFDVWGPRWECRGIKAWREMVEEWFSAHPSEKIVVDWSDVQSKQIDAVGFVSAFVKYTGTSVEGNALRSLQNRMTLVLEGRGDSWKIIHEHTSAPVDSDTLKVSMKRLSNNQTDVIKK